MYIHAYLFLHNAIKSLDALLGIDAKQFKLNCHSFYFWSGN